MQPTPPDNVSTHHSLATFDVDQQTIDDAFRQNPIVEDLRFNRDGGWHVLTRKDWKKDVMDRAEAEAARKGIV